MTIDQDAETARNGHVGYTHAQADAEGKDWLRDHPPYCAGCAALDRILGKYKAREESLAAYDRLLREAEARIAELEGVINYQAGRLQGDTARITELENRAKPDRRMAPTAWAMARITELEAEVERLRLERDLAREREVLLDRRIAELEDRRLWWQEEAKSCHARIAELGAHKRDLEGIIDGQNARIAELEAELRERGYFGR